MAHTKRDGRAENKGRKMSRAQLIALGATGVALTAGAVAAGAILTNKERREKVTEAFGKGMKALPQMRMPAKGRYQATAHSVSRGRKSSRGRKHQSKQTEQQSS